MFAKQLFQRLNLSSHRRLVGLAGWTSGSYGVVLGLRLVNNVVLARLLAPEIFGIMLIINTLRTGVDLLSDLGIGQNIVASKNAEDERFYNTAWTLQAIRGAGLTLLCCAIAVPAAYIYDNPLLLALLPAASLNLLFSGFNSTGVFLLQKRLMVAKLATFNVCSVAIAVAVQILFVLYSPTIWSLVWATVVSSLFTALISFRLVPGLRHRLVISRRYSREIFSFGKWVLLSSAVFFLAMNFDSLYLANAFSLTALGLYSVARALVDILSALASRVGSLIIFPSVAATGRSREELRRRIAPVRAIVLLAAAGAVSLFSAASGPLIDLLYDDRYSGAAGILSVLALGVWFAILSTINSAVLLGVSQPKYDAFGNSFKLLWLLVALPVAIAYFGLAGAVVAVAASDFARYVPLLVGKVREGLSFAMQDAALTACVVLFYFGWKILFAALGVTDAGPPYLDFAALRNTL